MLAMKSFVMLEPFYHDAPPVLQVMRKHSRRNFSEQAPPHLHSEERHAALFKDTWQLTHLHETIFEQMQRLAEHINLKVCKSRTHVLVSGRFPAVSVLKLAGIDCGGLVATTAKGNDTADARCNDS